MIMLLLRYMFFAAICCCVLVPGAFAQNCPSPPHPTIVSSFLADSSCLDTSRSVQGAGADKHACLVACEHQYTTYCVMTVPTNTYSWTVSGGTIFGSSTSNCVTVLWGAAGAGQITVTETDTSGCVGTDQRCVKIINSPVASFTAAANVCK